MRTLFINLFFFIALTSSYAGHFTILTDSVGVERIDGKFYIIHQVEQKETLYALSRRYNVSVKDIIAANEGVENGLDIGQRVKVPMKIERTSVTKSTGSKTHSVGQGETLFSISRQYNVKVGDIKKWNGLTDNSLEIGKKLIVSKSSVNPTQEKPDEDSMTKEAEKLVHTVKASETLFSISKVIGVPVDQIKEWNGLKDNNLSIGQKLIIGKKTSDKPVEIIEETDSQISQTVKETKESDDPFKESRVEEKINETSEEDTNKTSNATKDNLTKITKDQETSTDFEEVIDSGVAELIEGSANTRKYLALHRTANIGTIMKVKNEMNGQKVFVRVLGKLPDTDINKNVLIKISKAAYNRLGAIDPKFRVSISYIP